MKVFVVGGSGDVGTLVLPTLQERFEVCVYDLLPPRVAGVDYVEGSVTDYESLLAAMQGYDRLLYLAMGTKRPDVWNRVEAAVSHFDVNVKGVYLALNAAHAAGISHAVHASSMSVYDPLSGRLFPDEGLIPDSSELYGFTKRLGEECCRVACRKEGMSVNALRLCLPVSAEVWHERVAAKAGAPFLETEATDVARAMIAALEFPFGGFEAFTICGDWQERQMHLAKAKRLLGWEPLMRPLA